MFVDLDGVRAIQIESPLKPSLLGFSPTPQWAVDVAIVDGRAWVADWGRLSAYTADPTVDPAATRLEQVSYLDVIQKGLRAMDATAVTLCMDNDLPIVMFDLMAPGNVRSILAGESIGTLVA